MRILKALLLITIISIIAFPLAVNAQDGTAAGNEIFGQIFMWLGVVATVLGSLWMSFKGIAKFTKTKKDDHFADKTEDKVLAFLEKLPDELEQKIKDAFNGTASN